MKKLVRDLLIWAAPCALISLLACGGGGGGGGGTPPAPVVPALVTVSTLTKAAINVGCVVTDSSGNVFATSIWGQCVYRITPSGTTTVFAGSDTGVPNYLDGTGTAARFRGPYGLAIDALDNLYVAEYANHTIRKITPAGVVTTFAGAGGVPGYADANGTSAQFNLPIGIARDDAGNIYVADAGNFRIRKITVGGDVTTLAGSGVVGNADGTGTAASFTSPFGIAVDGGSSVYVTDNISQVIRKITAGGVVTTLAGTANTPGEVDGTGAAARFNGPAFLSLDEAGNLYVPDWSGPTIRKVTPGGVVTTVVGTAAVPGVADGLISVALIASPTSVWVKGTQLYIGDEWANSVRIVDDRAPVVPALNTVSTLASGITSVICAVTDSTGNVFATSELGHCVYKITPSGTATVFAGMYGVSGYHDAPGTNAQFNSPIGLAIDPLDNLYVSEWGNYTIRKITPAGVVTTFAGTHGVSGYVDANGTNAKFSAPAGITCDDAGNFYVADAGNHRIRKITFGGDVTTLAGSGAAGNADGTGAAASFTNAWGIAVYGGSSIYVTDATSHVIRKITRAGEVTTLAGTAGAADEVDGTGAAARFNMPAGLSLDQAGNLYVADLIGHTIRKVTPAGVVTTIAGTKNVSGSTNGAIGIALFNHPAQAWVSGTKIYVGDEGNNAVRIIGD